MANMKFIHTRLPYGKGDVYHAGIGDKEAATFYGCTCYDCKEVASRRGYWNAGIILPHPKFLRATGAEVRKGFSE